MKQIGFNVQPTIIQLQDIRKSFHGSLKFLKLCEDENLLKIQKPGKLFFFFFSRNSRSLSIESIYARVETFFRRQMYEKYVIGNLFIYSGKIDIHNHPN